MVDEIFLQTAVQIRRKFLKLNSQMELYARRVTEICGNLDGILEKLENLKNEAEKESKIKKDKSLVEKTALELNKILIELESEGKRMEDLMDPINKEIENLAIEEQELYRQIKEKNSHLTENEIVESVRKRLEEENLS